MIFIIWYWQCSRYFGAALFKELALITIREMWGLGLELPGLGLGFYDKVSVSSRNLSQVSVQSRRHGGLCPPNWDLKHYKSVEFLSIFRMSSPPAQTQSPPIENFLATVVSRSRRLRSRLHHCKWNANFNKICRKSESNLLFRFENTVTEGTWSQSKP